MRPLSASFVALLFGVAAIGSACTAGGTAPPSTEVRSAPTKASEPAKPLEATKAPAAPTQAVAATKAPTAAPTAVPTKAADFPAKGKAITIIVPFAAGGTTDLPARALAALMEKDLGTPVQVVNREGAGSQVGVTEVTLAKPDGYTLGFSNMGTIIQFYLDPERKATFDRRSFEPVALLVQDAGVLTVKGDSSYKSLKDLVDASKAKPESVKISTSGIKAAAHLAILRWEQLAGVKFAPVHFDGGAPGLTALLGGHIDAYIGFGGTTILTPTKSGQTRALGIMDKQEGKFLPGIKTFESQGYNLYRYTYNGLYAPGGTPKEVLDILAKSAEKAAQTDELKKKLEDIGSTMYYLGPGPYADAWDQEQTQVKALLELAR